MAAYAPDNYAGNGVATDFGISWPYLAQAHIKVELDGVLQTVGVDYTIIGGGFTVSFVIAPGSLVDILIRRESSIDERLQDWAGAGNITETALDTDSLQAFYLAQEAESNLGDRLQKVFDTTWDFLACVGSNIADPRIGFPQDVASKNYVDNLVTSGGNVPGPVDPGDDGKLLTALGSGTFGWGPDIVISGGTLRILTKDLRLDNAKALLGRDFANTADIPLIKIDASDEVIIGDETGGNSTGDVRFYRDGAEAFRIGAGNAVLVGDLDFIINNGKDYCSIATTNEEIPLIGLDGSNEINVGDVPGGGFTGDLNIYRDGVLFASLSSAGGFNIKSTFFDVCPASGSPDLRFSEGANVRAQFLYNVFSNEFVLSTEDLGGTLQDRVVIGAEADDTLVELKSMATEDIGIVDAGSVSATEQDWIEVTVGGVTGFVRVFATK